MEKIRQVLAVARMEVRFSYRRSAPVAVTALTGLLISSGILILLGSNLPIFTSSLTLEGQARWIAAGLTLQQYEPMMKNLLWDGLVFGTVLPWLLAFILLLLLPVATISSIPADRSFGVSELLRSTPLEGFRYLLGKTLGVVMAVLPAGAGMLVLFFIGINGLLLVHLHLGLSWKVSWYILKLSLLDGIPLLIWGAVSGILVGVLFRSRRAALLPGLVIGLLNLLFWLTAFRPPSATTIRMDRVEYYLLQNYHTIPDLARSWKDMLETIGITAQVDPGQIVLMYLTILALLGILMSLARLWLRWKENF